MAEMPAASDDRTRYLWVDFAKTLGIWGIVLLQVRISPILSSYIVTIVLPLFFFISGFLERDNKAPREAAIIGAKTLLVPYVIFSLVFYFVWLLRAFLGSQSPVSGGIELFKIIAMPLAGILLGWGHNTAYSMMLNSPLWFLVCLFFIKQIHGSVNILAGRRIGYRCLALAAIFVLTAFIAFLERKYSFRIIFSIDSAFLAYPFFALGNLARNINFEKLGDGRDRIEIVVKALIGIMGFIALDFFRTRNGSADISVMVYGKNLLAFYILGILGIASVLFLSFLYSRQIFWITVISNGALLILAFHPLVFFFTEFLGSRLGIEKNFLLAFLVSFMAVIVFIVPIAFLEKHCPMLLGHKWFRKGKGDNEDSESGEPDEAPSDAPDGE